VIKYIKKLVMGFSLKNTLVGQNSVETSQEQPQQQLQVQQQPQPQPQSPPQQPNVELELSEVEFLLKVLKDADLKGYQVEMFYNMIVKLQNIYLKKSGKQ
jgi:hypothetical protein